MRKIAPAIVLIIALLIALQMVTSWYPLATNPDAFQQWAGVESVK